MSRRRPLGFGSEDPQVRHLAGVVSQPSLTGLLETGVEDATVFGCRAEALGGSRRNARRGHERQ